MRAPLAVMMLDLDGLKLINDTHGHPVGAYTIAEVGKVIGKVVSPARRRLPLRRRRVRRVLAQHSASRRRRSRSARRFASRRRRIASRRTASWCKPTISHRRGRLSRGRPSAELLLRKADEALYRAKKTGRDRVRT